MTTQTTRLALLTMLSFGAFACDGATEDTAQTAGGSTTIEAAASSTVGPTEVAVYWGFYGDDDANAVRTEWRGEISVTDGSARIMDTFGFDTDDRVAARSRDFIEFAEEALHVMAERNIVELLLLKNGFLAACIKCSKPRTAQIVEGKVRYRQDKIKREAELSNSVSLLTRCFERSQ